MTGPRYSFQGIPCSDEQAHKLPDHMVVHDHDADTPDSALGGLVARWRTERDRKLIERLTR